MMTTGVSLTPSNFRLLASHLWLNREPGTAVPLLPQQVYLTLRNKLQLKFSKKKSVDRIPNPEKVKEFYEVFEELVKHHKLGPDDIFNLDETKICENDERELKALVKDVDQKTTNANTVTYHSMTVFVMQHE